MVAMTYANKEAIKTKEMLVLLDLLFEVVNFNNPFKAF